MILDNLGIQVKLLAVSIPTNRELLILLPAPIPEASQQEPNP
jgi:hypothetical protein